ncbi:hypothetical protein KKG05_04485, partial [bacterium]|nr:hypothetical protein [bacterium]
MDYSQKFIIGLRGVEMKNTSLRKLVVIIMVTLFTCFSALSLLSAYASQIKEQRKISGSSLQNMKKNVLPTPIQISSIEQDTSMRFQGQFIVHGNTIRTEPRLATDNRDLIPTDIPFILPDEQVDQELLEEMKSDAPRDMDDVCASHRDLDIAVLQTRISQDPAVADLLDFAQEKGNVELTHAIEFTYENDQIVSLAPLSNSAITTYLMSFGPVFEGKVVLCEIDTAGIRFFDREGSLRLPFNSRVPEINLGNRTECTYWDCMGGCIVHFLGEDPWLSWLCAYFCIDYCILTPNPYTCAACAGCIGGIFIGCGISCATDVCWYCDCPDPTYVYGYVRHADGQPWGGVDVRLADCAGTPFGSTM